MTKQILYGDEVSQKLLEGARKLHDAVAISLSPRGRNVGIDLDYGVTIHHDGVEIARSVDLEDAGENFAVKVLRQAANKQVAAVGDGTTVSIILAYAIYKECMRNIAAGTNPMSLVKGLEAGRDLLLRALKDHSTPVKTKDQAVQIAQISAQDEDLGRQIGETIFKLGLDGVVTTDESPTGKTYVETQEGLQFENGYISPAFITDPGRMEATVENTKILLTDKNLNNVHEVAPLMEQFQKSGTRSLVVIAADVTDSMLGSMIVTKIQGGMNLLAVKAPYAGQTQRDFLEDIAILTGGKVISGEAGERFENVELDDLGSATRVTSTERATMIVGGNGRKKDIKERVSSLKELMKRDGSDYQAAKIKERFAKLTNGIAVVKVGGPTEIEIKNWVERAKDAIEATTAALKEGFVPGGEIVYLDIRNVLAGSLADRILYNALERPFAKLLENAGMKPDAFLNEVGNGVGVDVTDGTLKDMVKSGIIDPALVTIESIRNSVSVAIALMTTEVLILPIKEKDGK